MEPVQPKDSVNALRDLYGDPNDEMIIKELEDIKDKVYADGRMNGTYLITDMSQEAAIVIIMLNIIKKRLMNQQFVRNRIKLGVSTTKPELF